MIAPLLEQVLYLHSFRQSVQFSSVVPSCPTLGNPIDCSTPGLPVHHQLLEFTQTHVHWVGDAIQPLSSVVPFSSCLQFFPASGSFPMSQFFASSGQNIGISASASVLPINIQDWFPLGQTGWISLLSEGLSRVFSSTFSVSLFLDYPHSDCNILPSYLLLLAWIFPLGISTICYTP